MRKLIFATLLLFGFSFTATSQTDQGFGFKGGLNYNANGKYFEAIGENAKNPDRNIGSTNNK